MSRGFFAVGIYHPKREQNVGGLWRAAHLYGASMIFTIGRRYQHQASDTSSAANQVPLLHFSDVDDLIEHLPHSAPLVGIELDPRATALNDFRHPERACYLLGAEDSGLPLAVMDRCHQIVQIESALPWSNNVASAGSMVLWHRHVQRARVAVAS